MPLAEMKVSYICTRIPLKTNSSSMKCKRYFTHTQRHTHTYSKGLYSQIPIENTQICTSEHFDRSIYHVYAYFNVYFDAQKV